MTDRTTARKSRIARLGNSLVVRIPREAVDRLNLKQGEPVSIEIGANSFTIRPTRRRKVWTAAQLLKGVTPDMVKSEISWGGPVGSEVL
jgi:antitoxin MazE